MRRYCSVFLFEDLPASDRRADEVYLKEVDRSDIYVGLFGQEYGAAGGNAPSPTEKEFDRATAKGKTRLIFVKGSDDKGRNPRMLQLIRRAGDELIRRRFQGVTDLTAAVYASLVDHLEYNGRLRTLPFDASACQRATLQDIDPERVSGFLRTSRRERRFALKATMPTEDALEVWNPGELPPSLTFDDLRVPHASIPRNPLLAEALFLTRYIEKAGTGTLDMIDRCRAAGHPEPIFTQRGGQFVLTFWRDSQSKAPSAAEGLSDRQREAVEHAKERGQITNSEYQVLLRVSKRTAHRDLTDLVRRGVLQRVGSTGRGTAYVLPERATKGAINGPMGPIRNGRTWRK